MLICYFLVEHLDGGVPMEVACTSGSGGCSRRSTLGTTCSLQVVLFQWHITVKRTMGDSIPLKGQAYMFLSAM